MTKCTEDKNFNPLHHEGGDRSTRPWHYRLANFNPLHHEGGDYRKEGHEDQGQISIHSTARVETTLTGLRPWWRPDFNPLHREGGDDEKGVTDYRVAIFQSTPPRGWRQQYYTITTTILHHISTNKSYPTPSNHGQPSLHTRKSVLIVQIFRCESPRKSMFASGSHQNTLYRFTARGQVRISAVLPH